MFNNEYERMCGSGLTPKDNKKSVLIIRAGRASMEDRTAIEAVKQARRWWLNWLTVTQRQWQRHPKTWIGAINYEYQKPGQAKHYAYRCARDHLRTREHYVRCS